MTIARPTHRRTNFAPAPEKYDANDQLAFRREVELHIQQIGSVTPFGPYYAIQANELGVQSTGFPVGHVHRYGATGNGVDDDSAAFLAAIAFAPANSTITGVPGAAYAVSAPVEADKALVFEGQGAMLIATAAMEAVGLSKDIGGVLWRNWHVDGGGLATSGIKSLANTVSVDGFTAFNCHVVNLATDHFLLEACIRVTSTNGALYRHTDVTVDNCSGKNSATAGCFIYYADGAKLTNWTGRNLDNHSYEFVNCTNFLAETILSEHCGGSGAGAGAQCYHGVMKGIVTDYCFGDGAVTVENTSADIRVSGVVARNCWKAGLSANFGESGHPFPNDVMRGIVYSDVTARAAAPLAITGATKSNPCKLTIANHNIHTIYLSNTVQVSISGVVGMTALNGHTGQITTLDPATGIHNPNAVWLEGVDSTGFATYTSGGLMAPYCNGANLYGGVPAISPNICLRDSEFDGFNWGVGMYYMDSSECRNIRVSRLQGPNSAVARFTYFRHGTVSGIRQTDLGYQPTDPLGAIQFLVQPGTANDCTGTVVSGVHVEQCGPSSNYPLFYVEGSPNITFSQPNTGGASCVVSTRAAADAPTIRIQDTAVALSTDKLYVLGAGCTPTLYVDYPRLPRTITVTSNGVYYDSLVRADASGGGIDYTPSAYANVIGKRIAVVKVDATANLVTAFGVTLAAHLDAVEAEATPNGWYVV